MFRSRLIPLDNEAASWGVQAICTTESFVQAFGNHIDGMEVTLGANEDRSNIYRNVFRHTPLTKHWDHEGRTAITYASPYEYVHDVLDNDFDPASTDKSVYWHQEKP